MYSATSLPLLSCSGSYSKSLKSIRPDLLLSTNKGMVTRLVVFSGRSSTICLPWGEESPISISPVKPRLLFWISQITGFQLFSRRMFCPLLVP